MNDTDYVHYRAEGRHGLRTIFTLDPANDGEAVNIELLRRALNWVTTNRDVHAQGRWFGFAERPGDVDGTEPAYSSEVVERVKARMEAEGADRVKALADTACGTTGCLFGWAVVMDSQEQEDGSVFVTVRPSERYMGPVQGWAPVEVAELELDDETHGGDWESAGRDRLGLSTDNAVAVSHADNSVGDLWRMASILTRGEIEVPAEFASYDGVAEYEQWLRPSNLRP
jgi:hypothetical protein